MPVRTPLNAARGTLALALGAPARPGLAAVRYDIPAGSLDQVLNAYAQQAGVMLTIDGALTAGLRSSGLRDGFRRHPGRQRPVGHAHRRRYVCAEAASGADHAGPDLGRWRPPPQRALRGAEQRQRAQAQYLADGNPALAHARSGPPDLGGIRLPMAEMESRRGFAGCRLPRAKPRSSSLWLRARPNPSHQGRLGASLA